MLITDLKEGMEFEVSNMESNIEVKKITETRLSYAATDGSSYIANTNKMGVSFVKLNTALEHIKSGHWKIVKK